jgi:hypothetical protein
MAEELFIILITSFSANDSCYEVQGVGLQPLACRDLGSNPAGAWLSVCWEFCVLSEFSVFS